MINFPGDPEERRRFFFEVLRADNERKERRRAELAEIIANAPVPDEVMAEVAWGWADLLKHHPGFSIEEKVRALSAMVNVFNETHTDLVAQLDRFHDFCSSAHFGSKTGREELLAIETAVDKELMAFSMAAMSLVDHVRSVRAAIEVADLDLTRGSIFDHEEHSFITDLRNMISHGHFPDVSWYLQWGEKRVSDFALTSERLLQTKDVGNNARRFITRFGERVQIRAVVASYSSRVRQFYAWYLPALEANATPELMDYRRCRKICRQASSRAWHRVMVAHAIQWKVDPYVHLDKYLTPDEAEAALRLPMRSKEQVDCIIAAADEHEACDAELRGMVYKLFRVNVDGNDAHLAAPTAE